MQKAPRNNSFGALVLLFLKLLGLCVDADLLSVFAQTLELDHAVDQGEQRIIFADADVVARMEFCAALAHQNVSREHFLPVGTLYAEALCLAVAPVVRGARSLFMSK